MVLKQIYKLFTFQSELRQYWTSDAEENSQCACERQRFNLRQTNQM